VSKLETKIERIEQLIVAINQLHHEYSRDYFETGKVEKVNLSKTIANVSVSHILNYRLNLHMSVNDYLMQSKMLKAGIEYFYRVKTAESIHDKIDRYAGNTDQYPVNNWLNDIFGCRIILSSEEIEVVENRLDDWQELHGLKNWYKRDKDGYKGVHIYFKNRNNFYFPWELQIWNEKDVESNVKAHQLLKRDFV